MNRRLIALVLGLALVLPGAAFASSEAASDDTAPESGQTVLADDAGTPSEPEHPDIPASGSEQEALPMPSDGVASPDGGQGDELVAPEEDLEGEPADDSAPAALLSAPVLGAAGDDAAGDDGDDRGDPMPNVDPDAPDWLRYPRGDVRRLIERLGTQTDFNKVWEGEEGADEITLHIEWKLDIGRDVEELHRAITIKGVDEEAIIKVMSNYWQIGTPARDEAIETLVKAYENAKSKPLRDLLKKALVGHLEELILDMAGAYSNPMFITHVDRPSADVQAEKLDEGGYRCWVEVKLSKQENWQAKLTGVIIPDGEEEKTGATFVKLIEDFDAPGNEMSWTREGGSFTVTNVYEPPAPEPIPAPEPKPAPPAPTALPKTGDAILLAEGAVAASGALFAFAGMLRRRRQG